jgi:hypothetical protein
MTTRSQRTAKVVELRAQADELDGRATAPTGELAPWRGTPILVGHSSEKGHRRTMARAAKVWDRQAADTQEAERLRQRAIALEATTAREIFDDDPDAIERLTAEIDALERTAQKLKDGAVSSMGPLQRKDAIADVRRQIRGRRKRIEALTSSNAQVESGADDAC